MKHCFGLFFALTCLSCLSQTAAQKPKPDEVVVKVLQQPMPNETNKISAFLWDNFANKPEEERFGVYTSDKWKENFSAFREALLAKAKAQELDSASLGRALEEVLKDATKESLVYLPVGAYQTKLDDKPVWIITVKWEGLSMADSGLVHIRMFAFDQKTLALVAFNTCM